VATAARARRARPSLQAGGALTAETLAAELTPATELVVDKAHYRQHPDCKTLVSFGYDPGHRLCNPDALEGDVGANENGLTTRVIVAPRPN